MDLREELARKKRETEEAIARRMTDLRHNARELEAAGHQVFKQAIRNGEAVLARTPSEVRALGLAAVQGRLPQAMAAAVVKPVAQRAPTPRKATSHRPATTSPNAPARNTPAEQLRAGFSGAVDEFTLGAADRVLSAGGAVLDGGIDGFGDRYRENMREKRAEDAYDSANYGLARTMGRVIGFGAGVAAMGGVGAAGKAALSRVPAGAKLIAHVAKAPRLKVGVDPRGLAQLAAGGGAAAGVVAQAVEDVVARRPSSVGQYGAAALGGAADGLATLRYGPARGGAIGGASESLAGDLLQGRAPSAERAVSAAHTGALFGRVGDTVGTYRAATLPIAAKGRLGERMSYAKAVARGKIPMPKAERRIKLGNRRFSIPDHRIGDDYIEAKLGPAADLTPSQRLARAQVRRKGNEFIVDAWQFRDMGKAAGIIAAPSAQLLTYADVDSWRDQ